MHFKVIGYDEDFIQIRKGNNQTEVKPNELTSVARDAVGYTKISVQACRDTGVFGSKCSGWEVFTLDNGPSGERFSQCSNYADLAIGQIKDAKKIPNCSLSGSLWSKNRDDHYEWCLGLAVSNYGLPTQMVNARQVAMNDCKGKIVEAAKNFTGTWTVSMQPVGDFTFVLTQQGPAVNGQMVNADPTKNGTIQGSLEADNQHVNFSYVQPQSNAGGQGRFWMEITKDKLGGRFFVNGEQAVRLLDGTRK